MKFLELCEKRYSCRSYLDKPVEDDKIMRCIQAAHSAPSACNSQPWHFIIVTRPETVGFCAKACESKSAGINSWVKRAPVFIALVTEHINLSSRMGAILKHKPYFHYDQGIACEHFCLQAVEEGLGSCIIGWYNERAIKKALSIPISRHVGLVMTLGYPKRDAPPAKVRRDINEIISREKYGS